jgi:hypothetical protein
VDGEQAVSRQQPNDGVVDAGCDIGKEVVLRIAEIEVLRCLHDAQIALLDEIGQGEALEEGLILFRQADNAGQASLNQALFGRAGLFGGEQALPGEAQVGEQVRFFLLRERWQLSEVSKAAHSSGSAVRNVLWRTAKIRNKSPYLAISLKICPNTLIEAHEAILKWVEANGYRIVGPSRELYLYNSMPIHHNDPSYVTEIQFPVEKALHYR